MARRKTASAVRSSVAEPQSRQGDNEQPSEPTRRLNVLISEAAFETLMVHMVRLHRPLGVWSRNRSNRPSPSSTSTATRSGAGGRGRLPPSLTRPSLTGKRIGETFTVP